MKYILASQSPRRRELLARTGLEFEVIPSDVDEKITKEIPSDVVMELAHQKAENVYGKITDLNDYTVIGSDTIVVYRDEILGKPVDKQEAYDMLSMLADRTHQVYTGVSLIQKKNGEKKTKTFFVQTDVTLYPIDKEDLHRYVESKDPMDKAGAYGIQGNFAIHVKEIKGDYNNVVGLPIGIVYQTTAAGLLKSTEWTTIEREVTLPESTSTRYLYLYAYVQGATVYVKDVEVLGQMSVYTEAQLKINSDSITQEVKRAKGIEEELRASIKVNADNITSCVTKGNVGSYITQYYNNVIVAFNNNSKYVQISAGEIAVYDNGVSASKKRAAFDQNGNHFYRDNYYVGKIGTNQWTSNNAHKGLVFDLEPQGKYMAWAQRATESASGYTTILCYSRANSIYTNAGLNLGCNMYGNGWILDNVDLRNCSANGYTTFTGTLPVVLEIHKTDNNGGIGWTYGNVYIKNGLITSIPQ